MTGPNADEEFEAYLRTRVVLQNRAPSHERLEPPEHLDDVVLAKARRAIQTPPQVSIHRAPRWALPVALAATVLLSLSVVLNIGLNAGKQQVPAAAVSPAPSRAAAESAAAPAAAAPSPVPMAAAPSPAPMTPAPSSAPRAAAPAELAKRAAHDELKADAVRITSTGNARATDEPMRETKTETAVDRAMDPNVWLKRIDRLRAEGKTAAADAEFRRFRAAFPTYPVKPPATSP